MKTYYQFWFHFSLVILALFFIISCSGTRHGEKLSVEATIENQIPILIENVRKSPENPQAHYQLAKTYFDVDSMQQALTAVNKSLELNGKSNRARLLRGDIFLEQQMLKQAYQDYVDVLTSETGDEFVESIRTRFGRPFPIYLLTSGDFNNAFPYFSPDGKRIAFQSDRDGNWEIYLMDVDGTQQVRLTNNQAHDEMPVFGVRSNIIAFSSTRDDTSNRSRINKARNIFLMDLLTGNVARVVEHVADDWFPALTDRGQKIAFVSERDDERDVPFQEKLSDIYLKDLQSSKLLRLTQNQADDGSPSFSSDGKWILFASNLDGNFQIYRMNSQGQDVHKLTHGNFDCGAPHFSHDGKVITFFADKYGNFDIFMMGDQGENVIRLTNNMAQDAYPRFSSDKRKIVFHSNRTGKYQLYWIDLMNPLNHDDLTTALQNEIDALQDSETRIKD